MPTLQQLAGKARKLRKYKDRRLILKGCPQRKATVDRRYIMNPRKPNSAMRKVA